VGPRAVLNMVVKRKISSPHWESKPRTPIIQHMNNNNNNNICIIEGYLQ